MTASSTYKISSRASAVPVSPIRKLMPLAVAAKARGVKVHHLNIGQPDLAGPPEFFEGLRLVEAGVLGYEPAKGNDALCEAWSQFMNSTLDLATTLEQFVITSGASEALLFAFIATCDPGDEILVFDPTYTNYLGLAHATGVNLRSVVTTIREGFNIRGKQLELEHALTSRTRALLVCNPNNPTGSVYSREDLAEILSFCEANNLYLIVDECYREMVFDDLVPLSIFHIAPNHPLVMVVDSLSKRFCLCGARIGCFIASNPELLAAANRLAQTRLAAPSAEQIAASHLLRSVQPAWIEHVRTTYNLRRDIGIGQLKQIEGAKIHTPQGAFYTIIELPVSDADDFARFMLEEVSVQGQTTFITPASGFYVAPGLGRNQFRIAFVIREQDLIDAIEAIRVGLELYRK